MIRIFSQSDPLIRRACPSVLATLAMLLGLAAAPAFAAQLKGTPEQGISPVGGGDFGGSELDPIGDNPVQVNPLDFRGHSDVPDLPDSGDDGDSQNNLGIYSPGKPMPGLEWYFDGPVDDFGPVQILPSDTRGALVAPSASAIPSPGGLLALGVAAVVTGARRRR